MSPFNTNLLSLFLLLTTSFSSYLSSQAKITYSDHCKVPQSTFSGSSLDTTSHVYFSGGYFSGGYKLFGSDLDPSSSSLTNSKTFYFSGGNIYRTEHPDIFHLSGRISIQTRLSYPSWMSSSRRNSKHITFGGSKSASFNLSGFWSKSTGKICLVGTGTTTSQKGNTLKLSAVCNLNYPNNSNIHTSVIGGKFESLDDSDSPSHFDTISVLGYNQNNYEYTQLDRVKMICSHEKHSIKLLGFNNGETSNYLYKFIRGQFRLEYGKNCANSNCSPFSSKGHEFLPSFISLNHIYVSEEGKVHMFIGFSKSSGFKYNLMPYKSLVAEGYWDSEKKILFLLACPVIKTDDPMKDYNVGECAIGLSFWFPAVFTIEERSNVIGHIWSTNAKGDPSYFSSIPFRSSGGNLGVLPGAKYKYSETVSMRTACGNTTGNNLMTERYPDGSSIEDLTFDLTVKTSKKKTHKGHATPVSFGENFYGDSIPEIASEVSFLEKNHSFSRTLSNVSYSISFSFFDASSKIEEITDISSEGVYNSGSGKFCMVGCLSIRGKSEGNPDCKIVINFQLSPLNQISNERTNITSHLTGTIRSKRTSWDPQHFETLVLSSYTMYNTEADETILRMDMEIIMVTIYLILLCASILFQLFHVRKHKNVLPSVSITMFVILSLGYMIPLVLNFEALFSEHRKKYYMLSIGGWLEADEVIVRIMSMVAFLLQFRLLQLAWASRSSEERKKSLWIYERKALRFCLPLYFAGALIARFVNTRLNATQAVNLDYLSTPSNYIWEDLTSYVGLIVDSFLLPQILLNVISSSKAKALSPVFYVGTASVRAAPHLYHAYSVRNYIPFSNSLNIYANPSGDYYSSVWDIVIPLQCGLFVVIIFLQQRFGGCCFLPRSIVDRKLFQ